MSPFSSIPSAPRADVLGASLPLECPLQAGQIRIGLFSPSLLPIDPSVAEDRRLLWNAEAVHRTNNLAQLAILLSQPRRRVAAAGTARVESLPVVSGETDRAAVALAKAYTALSQERTATGSGQPAMLPCAAILAEIVTGLIAWAGDGSGAVAIRVALTDVKLAVQRRRALVLIASELVVNALKHAFTDTTSGIIAVRLNRWGNSAAMTVEDDGGGPTGLRQGQGVTLIDGLATVLEATLVRDRSPMGGLRASLKFDLTPAAVV